MDFHFPPSGQLKRFEIYSIDERHDKTSHKAKRVSLKFGPVALQGHLMKRLF